MARSFPGAQTYRRDEVSPKLQPLLYSLDTFLPSISIRNTIGGPMRQPQGV